MQRNLSISVFEKGFMFSEEFPILLIFFKISYYLFTLWTKNMLSFFLSLKTFRTRHDHYVLYEAYASFIFITNFIWAFKREKRNGMFIRMFHCCASYWRMDCTLRELMSLIKEVNPDARRRGTVFDFAVGKWFLVDKKSRPIWSLFVLLMSSQSLQLCSVPISSFSMRMSSCFRSHVE